MGQGDFAPPVRRRKYDPKRAKKLKELGEKGLLINKKSTHHHETVEAPAAVDQLNEDLKEIFGPGPI